jgi:NAD-specific glutamate dehydrogenase
MRRHRLKREIVSTQIANDLVNHMGITFVQRLKESTGMSPANVAGAYVIVRDIFHLPHWFRQIEALDYQVSADVQLELMDELMRLGRRATRWFLRSRRNEQDAARDTAHFGPHLEAAGPQARRTARRPDPRRLADPLSGLRRSRCAGVAGAHGGGYHAPVHLAADHRSRRRDRA